MTRPARRPSLMTLHAANCGGRGGTRKRRGAGSVMNGCRGCLRLFRVGSTARQSCSGSRASTTLCAGRALRPARLSAGDSGVGRTPSIASGRAGSGAGPAAAGVSTTAGSRPGVGDPKSSQRYNVVTLAAGRRLPFLHHRYLCACDAPESPWLSDRLRVRGPGTPTLPAFFPTARTGCSSPPARCPCRW
jgi:hypothetical protein